MSEVLKQDILTKRAIGRRFIKNYGLKERLFVLTHNDLIYYEADQENMNEKRGKEKGKLDLSKVKAVEKVDNSTFNRAFCFQVIFSDYPLYVFARNDKQRDEWIHCLRKVITDKGTLLRKYHSGAYIENVWTCCHDKVRSANGCRSTFISSHGPESPKEEPSKVEGKETPPTENPFTVTAKFNFMPVQDTDLQLQKDQEYTVLNATGDKNWWFARDNLGREGYIPSNFVAKHVGIQMEKWYKVNMTRAEADLILKDRAQLDGTFIVHDSSKPAMYTLSFCFQGEVKHYHIKLNEDGKYYVSQRHPFDTISNLIEYHKLNSAGLVTRLRFPYTGSSEAPVTLGHGVFEISPDELQIKCQIGHGQFGTVHEALWKGKEKVAVKMMKEGTMQQHNFIEEAKLMQRFQHKNLVTLYGISYYGPQDSLCIVVELMPNGSLLKFLHSNNKNTLTNDNLMDLLLQVSCAMMYLEGEKFLHRDLAARNCLVGHNNIIKVADFGLARYVLDDEYTASEGTKLAIRWAAPEVIDYTRFSSKSDVWAFGILCWEVFSWGVLPYTKKSNQEIVEYIRQGSRLHKPAACPEVMFELIKMCWEQTPECRPTFKDIYYKLSTLTEDYEFF